MYIYINVYMYIYINVYMYIMCLPMWSSHELNVFVTSSWYNDQKNLNILMPLGNRTGTGPKNTENTHLSSLYKYFDQ